jgi:hypothetical protein
MEETRAILGFLLDSVLRRTRNGPGETGKGVN